MKKFVIFLLVLLTSVITVSNTSYATEDDPVGFTVEAKIPENQLDKEKTYFHLGVKPNTEQILEIKIRSTRKEAVTINPTVTNGVTNNNGMIDYGLDIPLLEDVKEPLTEMVEIPKEYQTVTVENFEEKTIKIKVRTTETPFVGIRLGAIRLLAETPDEKGTVISEYGYTIGMILSEDEKDPFDGGDLELISLEAAVLEGQKSFVAQFTNPDPFILENLNIDMIITKEDDSEFLVTENRKGMRIAPQSQFYYGYKWGMERLEPGMYHVDIAAESNDRNWQWNEVIDVDSKLSNELERNADYKLILPKWTIPLVITLALINLFVICFLFLQQQGVNRK